MTNSEIFELLDRFERSSVLTMKVCIGGDTLELSRAGIAASPAAAASATPFAAPAPAAERALRSVPRWWGRFYAAAAPDQPPLVKDRRPGPQGTDRVSDRGHEDDERGHGPL